MSDFTITSVCVCVSLSLSLSVSVCVCVSLCVCLSFCSKFGMFSLKNKESLQQDLQSESSGREPENGKSQKWLGEGAKGLLSPGGKSLPRVFCTIRNPFCTSATPFCTSATPFSLLGLKRPFAPSPNHFWDFTISGFSPRTFGLQNKIANCTDFCEVSSIFPGKTP